MVRQQTRREQLKTHNKKLENLSDEQERPLFSVKNTVVLCDIEQSIPGYVMETLSLGPKNAVLDKFDQKEVLAEVDKLLNYCKNNDVSDEVITDINVKTLTYIKKCKKMKCSRNINLTKKFLKENDLLAVPFDKGVGICVMRKHNYEQKMDKIINLPQFQKYKKPRKNAKNPVLKEEDRVVDTLKELLVEKKIDEKLYEKLKPIGSQPPRLCGLAKVQRGNTSETGIVNAWFCVPSSSRICS